MTPPPMTPPSDHTTCSDPADPRYVDEVTVRAELTRVFQICHECRRCESSCATFPSLFDLIERRDDHDAGRLTPAEQDAVVDSCVHCDLCAASCPYQPAIHELAIDLPRLVLRAKAMQFDVGIISWRAKSVAATFGRADLVGRAGSELSGLANRFATARPGSLLRRFVARVSGVSAQRRLRPYRSERFSTWFNSRLGVRIGHPQGSVTVFPTCLVEYRSTEIGADLVRVYERNGVECSMSGAGCCGAPALQAGDIGRFAQIAKRNVTTLAREVKAGRDIVVPEPGCGAVIRTAYPTHVAATLQADASLVAERTFDTSEYLMRLHRADETVLDTDFDGRTIDRVTTIGAGHLTAAHAEFDSRDLLRLTGARVHQVRSTAGTETPWGVRSENDAVVDELGGRLAASVSATGADVVSADGDLTNAVLSEHLDVETAHPMQIVARAYGIGEPIHR